MASLRQETGKQLGQPASTRFEAIRLDSSMLRRRRGPGPLGVLWLGFMLLAGAAIGLVISTDQQWQNFLLPSPSPSETAQNQSQVVAGTIQKLEAEQADLNNQIATLGTQLDTAKSTDAQQKSTLQDATQAFQHQKALSGMLPLHGNGVIFTLSDSTDSSVPSGEDPANYIIHDYDLRDVLSTLWSVGAEAISINGERIVGTTSVYCVGTTIIVNATRLSPPYEVRAIGNPSNLQNALKGAPQMTKLNQRALIYDLSIKIKQQNDVSIPAYNGSLTPKYTQVGN